MERNSIGRRDKTRVHSTRPLVPILFAHPYPDSAEKAFVEAGVYFYKSTEWYSDENDDIWFVDQFSKEKVHFNKMNTSNQYHLMRGERIITDLLDEVSYLPNKKNSKSYDYFYPRNIIFEVAENENAAASTKPKGVLAININSKNKLEGNKYKLMSIFRHELLHIREQPLFKNIRKDYTFMNHADVYEEQMTYPEFSETPENYQLHIIKQYILRVFNAFYKNTPYQPNNFINALEKFNHNTGKKIGFRLEVQKKHRHLNNNERDVKVLVYSNGIQRTTVEYEEVSDPLQ